MKFNHPIALMSFAISFFLTPVSVQADPLSATQKQMLDRYLSELSADEIDQIRNNAQARLQFLRNIASSMTPEQRETFRNSWKGMTVEERQQALHNT